VAKQRLHIHYASMNHFNSLASNIADVKKSLDVGADIVAYDECIALRSHLRSLGQQAGYKAVIFAQGQEAFMIKDQFGVAKAGRIQVTPHIYWSSKRYISWCRVNFYGQFIWPHAAHWMIQVGETGHVQSNATRARLHTKITDAMIRKCQQNGVNPNLAFFMGDTNVDEGKDNAVNDHRLINYRFNKGGLRTIWDEFRVSPPTHGTRTYDIIGKYDPKGRVDGVRYKVWPKLNSDHRPISAWYDIDMKKPVASTGSGGTSGGGASSGGTPSTPTKNYQWWDYSDYDDDVVYDLPTATDDSGDPDE
jgi:hypothetical protein